MGLGTHGICELDALRAPIPIQNFDFDAFGMHGVCEFDAFRTPISIENVELEQCN